MRPDSPVAHAPNGERSVRCSGRPLDSHNRAARAALRRAEFGSKTEAKQKPNRDSLTTLPVVDSAASLENSSNPLINRACRGLAPPSLIEPLTNHQPARRGRWCLSARVQARIVIFMLAGVASGDMAQNCPRLWLAPCLSTPLLYAFPFGSCASRDCAIAGVSPVSVVMWYWISPSLRILKALSGSSAY